MESPILTKQETADFLKISLRTLDYLISVREIPYTKTSKRAVRFHRDRVLQWFAEREQSQAERR